MQPSDPLAGRAPHSSLQQKGGDASCNTTPNDSSETFSPAYDDGASGARHPHSSLAERHLKAIRNAHTFIAFVTLRSKWNPWPDEPEAVRGLERAVSDALHYFASSESTPEPGSETRPGETEKRCSATPTFGSQGAAMIAAERARQVEVEGYDDEHDSEHVALYENALPLAAVAYILAIRNLDEGRAWWPWDGGSWKPKDAMRNRVRAGALLAAEIDRRLRTDAPRSKPSSDTQSAQDAPLTCPVANCKVEHYFQRVNAGPLGYEPDEAQAYDAWKRAHASSEDGEPAQDEREALFSLLLDVRENVDLSCGQITEQILKAGFHRGVRRVSLPAAVRESDEGI